MTPATLQLVSTALPDTALAIGVAGAVLPRRVGFKLSDEQVEAISGGLMRLTIYQPLQGESMETLEQASSTEQRISIEYGAYNPRRYSRPWIARVTAWPVGGTPTMEWGSYVGDDHGGEVEIMATPGDIIRDGQRDGRGGNNTVSNWSVVMADYTLRIINQVEARKLFRASC
jgi:hypothetical protein